MNLGKNKKPFKHVAGPCFTDSLKKYTFITPVTNSVERGSNTRIFTSNFPNHFKLLNGYFSQNHISRIFHNSTTKFPRGSRPQPGFQEHPN